MIPSNPAEPSAITIQEAGPRLLRYPQKPHTYQKTGLKSVARIREWGVRIDPGIPGIRNLEVPGEHRKHVLMVGKNTN